MKRDRAYSAFAGVFVFIAIVSWSSFSFRIETAYFKFEYEPPSEKEIEVAQKMIALISGTISVFVADEKIKKSNKSQED